MWGVKGIRGPADFLAATSGLSSPPPSLSEFHPRDISLPRHVQLAAQRSSCLCASFSPLFFYVCATIPSFSCLFLLPTKLEEEFTLRWPTALAKCTRCVSAKTTRDLYIIYILQFLFYNKSNKSAREIIDRYYIASRATTQENN